MPRIITDSCINCGSCENVCPVGAISVSKGKYVIEEDSCIDCGKCEYFCPAEAIENDDLDEEY